MTNSLLGKPKLIKLRMFHGHLEIFCSCGHTIENVKEGKKYECPECGRSFLTIPKAKGIELIEVE